MFLPVPKVMTEDLRSQDGGQFAQGFQMLEVNDQRPQGVIQHNTEAFQE
jgi:hypothetical protein